MDTLIDRNGSQPFFFCLTNFVRFLEHNAGTLLCVLLPPLTNANSSAGTRSKLQTVVTSAALPLWGIATVTTATGRVLGDAHWISDTMAGACLGAGLVSLTTVLCNKLAPESR